MTLQIPDSFIYREKTCDVVEYSGEGVLFEPSEFGLFPRSASTASHRGYRCTFAVLEQRLCLKHLDISLYTSGEENPWESLHGSPVNGVEPDMEKEGTLFNNRYTDINLPLPCTGRIAVAAGFIQDLYVHMGFAPAWKYREVYQFTFTDGLLQEEKDISEEMKKLRERILTGGDTFPDPTKPKTP